MKLTNIIWVIFGIIYICMVTILTQNGIIFLYISDLIAKLERCRSMHHVLVRVLEHNLYDRMTFLAISTTETLTDLKTDMVVANNNNNLPGVKHMCGMQCQIVLIFHSGLKFTTTVVCTIPTRNINLHSKLSFSRILRHTW